MPGLKPICCHAKPELPLQQPVGEENPVAVVGVDKLTTEEVPVPKFGNGLIAEPIIESYVQDAIVVCAETKGKENRMQIKNRGFNKPKNNFTFIFYFM